QVLLHKTLGEGLAGLEISGGQWRVVNGLLQQSGTQQSGVRVFTGDKQWTDYTVSVKARKVSGNEGFNLIFRALDERNFASLTVGGKGNTRTGFAMRANN